MCTQQNDDEPPTTELQDAQEFWTERVDPEAAWLSAVFGVTRAEALRLVLQRRQIVANDDLMFAIESLIMGPKKDDDNEDKLPWE